MLLAISLWIYQVLITATYFWVCSVSVMTRESYGSCDTMHVRSLNSVGVWSPFGWAVTRQLPDRVRHTDTHLQTHAYCMYIQYTIESDGQNFSIFVQIRKSLSNHNVAALHLSVLYYLLFRWNYSCQINSPMHVYCTHTRHGRVGRQIVKHHISPCITHYMSTVWI